jgi:S-DNA-T family DNA segregation ATPase FtsK/SpoIIIE
MARSSADAGKAPFLPAGARLFIRRRAVELGGLALFALGVALIVALASYSATDPSGNNAVDGPVNNLLGPIGAHIADAGLQSIGLAALLPGVMLISWGYRILAGKGVDRPWVRLTLLPLALLALAMGAAGFVPPTGWSLRVGLGGFLGQLTLGEGAGALSSLGLTLPILVLSIPLVVVGLALAFYLLAFTGPEWATGRRIAWVVISALGRIAHKGGAQGTRAGQGLFTAARQAFAGRKLRIEPRMGRGTTPKTEPRLHAPTADDSNETDIDSDTDSGSGSDIAPDKSTNVSGEIPIAPRAGRAIPGKRAATKRQATLNLIPDDDYALPPLELLELPPELKEDPSINKDALEANAKLLMTVLEDFGVSGEIIKVRPGPVVTLYELEPAPGIKSSRVIGLSDDIARSMSAVSVRIAVVPGRNVIGIELPNARRETVYLRELLASEAYERTASKLTLVLGKDIGGAAIMADLSRMPHLLIAGTTGSGKSVAINTMILSLLYRLTPKECRFIMIDPKMLELSVYDDIPHLLAPVVTEPGKAVVALRWTVKEMEHRYRCMSELGVRNILGYNQRLAEARTKGTQLTRRVQTGFDPETGKPMIEEQELDLSPLPFIVVVVDEMADLMLVAGKDIEAAVQRLAQMARAAGIHIIMATQRPSVDVITGTIKANFPTRISFQVTSKIDSRTILGEQGAEQLLGQGDMLFMQGGGRITRVHGPFVSDIEVEQIVEALKAQGEPDYLSSVTEDETEAFGTGGNTNSGDQLYDQAIALVLRERKASTSFIQRHLQIGYNRAARLMDQLEADGIVTAANHVGKREILGPPAE